MTLLNAVKKQFLLIAPIALMVLLGACKDDDIRIVTYDFSDAFENVEIGTVNTPTNPPLEVENLEPATTTAESTESANLITDITDGTTDATTDEVIADVESIVSSYFDATATKILQDNFVRVAAWYDNEWAFSVRMLDIAKIF